ncbi:helix-turn-helix domain-containing protein [Phaeobacter sp. J2-8]|uniref:helix-turn-helix domain-containing protein n=1 Tax=Phaeobacter sp. J2-8 TaxID=2931394 RepID=UPI002453BF98|nr:helix-turn-helix domain-containing protein [Phaeobacter sp. J2-8]
MNTILPAASPRRQTVEVCQNSGSTAKCVDRWELLSLVTGLRKELGLADRDVMVLRAHLSVMPHGPLDPAGLNISFMSITNILERACGMDERRFRRGETRLEQAGLIRRQLSGNGRRFPERDKSGRVVNAYGIDLAPLLASYDDLLAMADWRAEQDRVARTRRNSISARLSAAVRAVIASNGALPNWVDALRDRLRKAVRRKSTVVQEFDAIENEIARLEALTSVNAKAQIYPGEREPSEVVPDKCPGDDGQTVRHIEFET